MEYEDTGRVLQNKEGEVIGEYERECRDGKSNLPRSTLISFTSTKKLKSNIDIKRSNATNSSSYVFI